MSSAGNAFTRRARPLLGTLVEIGAAGPGAGTAIAAAFARIAQLQARLSRFEPGSTVGRFNVLPAGGSLTVDEDTCDVLQAARHLQDTTEGAFDITLGQGPQDWVLDGKVLYKQRTGLTIDLGGIGKGHAVDLAVALLQAQGCSAGWVNAGGDLRAFGGATLSLQLRDEAGGGTRTWGRLQEGACATSHFAVGGRSALVGRNGSTGHARHLSVIAPHCLWADALTKVAALDPKHSVLRRFCATAWLH